MDSAMGAGKAATVGGWRRFWKALSDSDEWTPRRPLLSGALLAFGCGVLLIGDGVLWALAHDEPKYVQIWCWVAFFGGVLGLTRLAFPQTRYVVPLLLLGVFLVVAVPAGFRSAVLDLRGEYVTVTVTEVIHEGPSYAVSQLHRCEVEAADGTFWVRSDDAKCGAATRPGDRFEVLRDPGDLVGATTELSIPIPFTLLVPVVGGVLLLVTVLGARGLNRATAGRPRDA
ncbi:hypothetical protein MHW47_10400 [Streptomyces sp. OfavH-34-F]|uniref:hypothetical protein n=1 Tax=Streptomyces sp. OfavH-34-F TaxID=2917760 RepID=UPI001EF2D33B|nr:hypothetical protein [Streptomyces sp. OfavH-34-F]MCG7524846.1 hypothetical protein [Streptomyces sp. OfavH-34-F]